MSAKKPKAPKVPELPPPPAITDPRVQEAESNDRLARRKGSMAAIYAGTTNRRTRPAMSAADIARATARADRTRGNTPTGIEQRITDAAVAERQRWLASAGGDYYGAPLRGLP